MQNRTDLSEGDSPLRDYLYIYNDPVSRYILASGIEFRDIADRVGLDGGLIVLMHDARIYPKYMSYNRDCSVDYVPRASIPELAKEDIYNWGDFCWVDYVGEDFPTMPDRELAELAFFEHRIKPLKRIVIPSLGNKYLCYAHDDGWLLQLYYSDWADILALIGDKYPQLDFDKVRRGETAYWVSGDTVEEEEIDGDMDSILNRRFPVPRRLRHDD